MKDLLIVGRGLAAQVLAHACSKHKLSFHIIGREELSSCSRVAAGIWNPVVFKRLTKSWMASRLIPYLETFYAECEQRTGECFLNQRELIRPFSEEQEKNYWLGRARNELEEFLDQKVYEGNVPELKMPVGYGKVLRCGNLDMHLFLNAGNQFFAEQISDEFFEHERLQVKENEVCYKDLRAKGIVFCEGHLIRSNPWFSFVPMKPVKGETMEVQIQGLKLKNGIVNKGGFIMDLGAGTYRVGATYDWEVLDDAASEAGKKNLEEKLEQITHLKYKVLSHKAGIRPSSLDRRPVIGPHPQYRNLHVFNGLGTKGVMLAPYFANNFVLFVQNKEDLLPEVNVKRFYHLHHGRAKA